MTTALDPGTIWMVVTVVAVVSFAFRLSFLLLFNWVETVPPQAERVLGFVAPAVIAALVLPALLVFDGSVALRVPELTAALVAGIVAWRTRNVGATVAAGMIVFWSVSALS